MKWIVWNPFKGYPLPHLTWKSHTKTDLYKDFCFGGGKNGPKLPHYEEGIFEITNCRK